MYQNDLSIQCNYAAVVYSPLKCILEQDGKGNTGMDMDIVAGIFGAK